MATTNKHFRKRDAILEYLRSTRAHPSAEMIYADLKPQIPDLAMGTVYRNLSLFKEKGLVTSVATVKGVERFDGNTDPHVHFICSDCDAVIDLMEMEIPQALSQAAEAACGGNISECQLCFTGYCRECTAERNKVL